MKRRFEILELKADETATPSVNEEWRVLAGNVLHVNGTETWVTLGKVGTPTTVAYFLNVPAASATATYALNPIKVHADVNEKSTVESTKIWFDDTMELITTVAGKFLIEIFSVGVAREPVIVKPDVQEPEKPWWRLW